MKQAHINAPIKTNRSLRGKRRAGFSLVEVTLAMMVIAVGILAVMSLFPAGLEQNMRSIEDTRKAFFAEEVFSGIQAWAAQDWDNLVDFDLPPAAVDEWHDPLVQFLPQVENNWNRITTNRYIIQIGGDELEHHALRYRLGLTTNQYNTATATLWVWGGRFGTDLNPAVFYNEFYHPAP